jgi:hypothetical protein
MIRQGDKVVYKKNEDNQQRHEACPTYYPAPGTVGIVVIATPPDGTTYVRWPQGAIKESGGGSWVNNPDIEPFEGGKS